MHAELIAMSWDEPNIISPTESVCSRDQACLYVLKCFLGLWSNVITSLDLSGCAFNLFTSWLCGSLDFGSCALDSTFALFRNLPAPNKLDNKDIHTAQCCRSERIRVGIWRDPQRYNWINVPFQWIRLCHPQTDSTLFSGQLGLHPDYANLLCLLGRSSGWAREEPWQCKCSCCC